EHALSHLYRLPASLARRPQTPSREIIARAAMSQLSATERVTDYGIASPLVARAIYRHAFSRTSRWGGRDCAALVPVRPLTPTLERCYRASRCVSPSVVADKTTSLL